MEYRDKYKRMLYLDYAKGIGIILVVLGHTLTKDIVSDNIFLSYFRTAIYFVHMPLFFVIAGILFATNQAKYRVESTPSFVLKKTKLYIVPYVVNSVILILIFNILNAIGISNRVGLSNYVWMTGKEVFQTLIIFKNPVSEHLWFAYVMFLVITLSFLCVKFIPKNFGKYMFIIVAAMFVLTYTYPMPYVVKKVCRYLLYFGTGYILERKRVLSKICGKGICGIIGSLIVLFGIYFRWYASNNNNMIIQGLIIFIIGTLGSIVILFICHKMPKKISEVTSLDKLGRKSYAVYLFHQPFLVSGFVAMSIKLNVPIVFIVVSGTLLGIVVPLILEKYMITKSRILSILLLGNHS